MDIRNIAEELFTEYPCRFKSDEKSSFITYIRSKLLDMGYSEKDITVELQKGLFKTRNIVIGDPKTAKRFITAHYDTPGRNGFLLASSSVIGQTGANVLMLVVMLAAAIALLAGMMYTEDRMFADGELPFWAVLLIPLVLFVVFFGFMFIIMVTKNPSNRNDNTSGVLTALSCADRLREKVQSGEVCVVLFDNEEWGLVGAGQLAAELRRRKVKMKERTVINFDCIGVGDRLIAATVGRQHKGTRAFLDAMDEGLEKKIVRKCSFVVYMSDHARFRDSFMLSAAKRSKLGPFYLPNIHTARDVECDLDLVGDIADRVCGVIEK